MPLFRRNIPAVGRPLLSFIKGARDHGIKIVLPILGLALFLFWCGLLVKEMRSPPTTVDRQPQPEAFVTHKEDLNERAAAPPTNLDTMPEGVGDSATPVATQPNAASAPTAPKLTISQIFARLDKGEITVEETKAMLASNGAPKRQVEPP